MKSSGYENKKLITSIIITIILVAIFARVYSTTANELSSEFDVVILKTNNDERVNLAQETLASQLSQFNIPTIVKTVFNWENLTYEFDQSKTTSLLVLIGHGIEIGLYVGKEVVLWTTLKDSLIRTNYPWKLLLTCHSDEISDAERGIAGFRDEIDAEGGAYLFSFVIKKFVQNIHDESLLNLAVQKSEEKANPLAIRKIFFVHGYAGDLEHHNYEWENLLAKIQNMYIEGTFQFVNYSYIQRGFNNEYSGIDDLSADLKTFILANTQPGEIIDLIGHSMGGIAIRDMIRQYRENLNSAGIRVEKGILIASPNEGCPWAGVLIAYHGLGWAIWLILVSIFGYIPGELLWDAVEFLEQKIADGWDSPRFRFFHVENTWFDSVLNNPATKDQYSGIDWYGSRVYANLEALIAVPVCFFYNQEWANDQLLSVTSTKLPDLMSPYIISEEQHYYYIHEETHTDIGLVEELASWLDPKFPYIENFDDNDVIGWDNFGSAVGTGFITSNACSMSGMYSGKQYGGSGSIFRFDKWNTFESINTQGFYSCTSQPLFFSGWFYNSHTNYYGQSLFYLVKENGGTEDYIRLRFYKGSLYIDKKINGIVTNGVQVYSLGENFNQKWWQFEVRLSGGQDDIWMQVAWKKYGGTVTKPSIFMLDDSNHGFLGFITLGSRVGDYGGTFWDDIWISDTKVGGLL